MYDINSVIRIAHSQVGYREGRTAAGRWNNDQKYSEQVKGLEWSDHQPWCATFVCWCLTQTGILVPAGALTASCRAATAAYKKARRFTEYPITGGQILFGPEGGSHTGIVTKWDETHVWTIEGNTNSSGSAEGDGVYAKRRLRRDPYVYGYGIPYYENNHGNTPDPVWRNRSLGR